MSAFLILKKKSYRYLGPSEGGYLEAEGMETGILISKFQLQDFSCKTIGKEEGEENPTAKQNIILQFAKLTYNFLYIL